MTEGSDSYDKRVMQDFLKDIQEQSPENPSPPQGAFTIVSLPVIEGIMYGEAEH